MSGLPDRTWQSVLLTVVACTRTSTSSSLGLGRSTSRTLNMAGDPYPERTAAFMRSETLMDERCFGTPCGITLRCARPLRWLSRSRALLNASSPLPCGRWSTSRAGPCGDAQPAARRSNGRSRLRNAHQRIPVASQSIPSGRTPGRLWLANPDTLSLNASVSLLITSCVGLFGWSRVAH
jgi:hypothetical protein